MVQHVQPEAPYPPQPPHMGGHPGIQQLPAEMERMGLHHGMPQYGNPGNPYAPHLDGHYTHQPSTINTQLPIISNGKVPVTYEGWNFTKQAPSRANEKATWALAVKTKMPLSQDELRDQVSKQKKKGKSVTDQYNDPDMDGFKKKQVDRLIADKTRNEIDPRFEYKLASLKLDQGRTKQNSRQTNSMQVILKRVYRSGDSQPLASGKDRAQELEGEVVDLTLNDEVAYSYSSGSQGQYGVPPSFGDYVHVPPHDEHTAYYQEQGPPMQAVHPDAYPPMHHQPDPHMSQHPAHHQQPHEHHEPQGHHEHHPHHDQVTPEKMDKKDKKDKKKDHRPEVHQKKDRKHKDYSEPSSDSDAGSSLYTDRTPDTEYSAHSAHAYHKEKKQSSSRRSSRRDSRSHEHDLSPIRQAYRERRRKSPARSNHSGEYEEYEIITSDRHDDRPYKTSRTYVKSRPAYHQRAMSNDDDRFYRPTNRQKRINSYAHPVLDEHPHEEKERLKWEIEDIRQRQKSEERRREADRLETQRLELERVKLETEREAAKLERVRLDNENYNREKYNRDRYDRADRYIRDDRLDQNDRYERNDRFDRSERGLYDPFVERDRPRRRSVAYDQRRDDLYRGYRD